MYVIASVAISQDGYIDDTSDDRLLLSSQQDLEQIHELRASCDAILVGANTVRKDNPSLTARTDPPAYPSKVTITKSGELDVNSNFFTAGPAHKIIYVSGETDFSIKAKNTQAIELNDLSITNVLKNLDSRDFLRVMIEGGASILKQALQASIIDEIRVAVAPISVKQGIKFMELADIEKQIHPTLRHESTSKLGNTTVYHYTKNLDATAIHNKWMEYALVLSKRSPAHDRYKVGSVITDKDDKLISTGFTHEVDNVCHAEEVAINKAISKGLDLTGCNIYATMEPCSERASRSKTCSQLIIEHKMKHMIFAYHEPDIFVEKCQGESLIEQAGLKITHLKKYATEVAQINNHIIK